jgi:ribonuclease Y
MVMLAFGLIPGLALGGLIGRWFGRQQSNNAAELHLAASKTQAQQIILNAQSQADDLLRDAHSRAEQTLADSLLSLQSRRAELDKSFETRLSAFRAEQDSALAELDAKAVHLRKKEDIFEKREESVNKRLEAIDRREADLKQLEADLKQTELDVKKQNKTLKKRIKKAEEIEAEVHTRISEIANLSPEQARQIIIDEMVSEARMEAGKRIKILEDEATEEAEKRAKRIISIAIQRYAGEYVTERCVTTVVLPSDEMKGRIIGREGRNIRAIEAATGVDLIVDDTPEAVVVSGFDPVRREIARISIERLIADGRIHPSRIEEIVGKVTREIDQIIKESGDQAAFELGLHGLHPEILRLIGRLRYRTSYGQNIWSHSIEVGWLCGLMAAELGLNVKTARRCGLLHDIGKALDHELEGSHAILGAEFCKKHGEKPLILNAIAAHHNEVPQESVYAHLVMAADALSGARPGARREILETYIKRLEDLERISLAFEGVEKCHALQAGREIRVMVNHSRIDDASAVMLSRDIARKIEQELSYPGQIKVTVIRETRATEFAR